MLIESSINIFWNRDQHSSVLGLADETCRNDVFHFLQLVSFLVTNVRVTWIWVCKMCRRLECLDVNEYESADEKMDRNWVLICQMWWVKRNYNNIGKIFSHTSINHYLVEVTVCYLMFLLFIVLCLLILLYIICMVVFLSLHYDVVLTFQCMLAVGIIWIILIIAYWCLLNVSDYYSLLKAVMSL